MAKEIERKFLVKKDWKPQGDGVYIAQGYLCSDPDRTVRIRRKGASAYLTIKGRNEGIERPEFEYEIPCADGDELLKLCPNLIEKTRYTEEHGGFLWEIDIFHGRNEGLVLAEIELPNREAEFDLPAWAAEEVSGDPRYYNSQLSKLPYSQ